jgi:hypothetical protein
VHPYSKLPVQPVTNLVQFLQPKVINVVPTSAKKTLAQHLAVGLENLALAECPLVAA